MERVVTYQVYGPRMAIIQISQSIGLLPKVEISTFYNRITYLVMACRGVNNL